MNSDRIVGTAKKLGGKAEGVIGDMTGDTDFQLEGAVDQVKGTVQAAYGQAREKVGQARETVRQYADDAYDAAGEAYEQGRRYVDEGRRRLPDPEAYYRDGRRAVSRQVEESPIAAMLVAGVVGYILAVVIHGRK